MRTAIRTVLPSLLLLLTTAFAAIADTWGGDWDTQYGQLRLIQNGDRLFGDYQDRGVIEGLVSADGRTARAVFVYTDGRWGTVEWLRTNDQIRGHWQWSTSGLPSSDQNPWTGRRTDTRTSALKYASQSRRGYPAGDPQFSETARPWITAIAPPGPAPQYQPQPQGDVRNGLGIWYGGYALLDINPAFDIGLNVIHYGGSNTASVDMSIYAGPNRDCPAALHVGFCDALMPRIDSRGYVDVQVTGATILNRGNLRETLEVTFRLIGDQQDRLLRIIREATYFSASLHSAERGYDYVGFAQGHSHLCEQSQCQNAVFADVRDNPARYRSNVDRGYLNRLRNLPNQIAQSHQPNQPIPRPSAPVSDTYAILDETSENLGEITLSPNGNRLAASGRLRNFFETGGDHEMIFTWASTTDEAVAFDITIYAGGAGGSKQGRLIFSLPQQSAGNSTGTLIVADDIFLIELVRPIQGLRADEIFDTPAIGIYSVNYALRDVPAGQSMRLRQTPDRSSSVVGAIPFDADGLQILQCTPEIDSQRFMTADQGQRLALLNGAWCQIANTEVAGWVPGRYLSPQL